MITAITIENFKGIGEPVRLELRPITLLFGMNSAGKSSLLHALIYAREVFERHNLDADRTLAAGDNLDLGGFLTFVRNHERKNTIRLRFELNLTGIDLPGSWDPEIDSGFNDPEYLHLSSRATSAEVAVSIPWSEREGRPYVAEYEVGINGRRFARVVCDAPGKGARIVDLDEAHPVFFDWSDARKAVGRPAAELPTTAGLAIPGTLLPATRPLEEVFPEFRKEVPEYFRTLLTDARRWISPVGESGAIGISDQHDALPDLESVQSFSTLRIATQHAPGEDDLGEDDLTFHQTRPQLVMLGRILYQLVVGPALLLRDVLRQFRYIGPLRQIPPRDYIPPRLPDPARWANGMAGWDLLFSRPTLVDRVSRLLADTERLNLGYTLEQVEFREFESRNRLLAALQANRLDDIEDIESLLKKSKRRSRLLFRPLETPDVTLEPADLGVGIGQMIPTLAAALDDQSLGSASLPVQLVALEHPELNLHPRLQAEIGDVFLEGALAEATKGRVFVIETHSEHVTLRLCRRIRESTRGQSQFGFAVKPTDVGVWHVDRSTGSVSVSQILVDVEGEFVQPWPEDDSLFEQDFRERYA